MDQSSSPRGGRGVGDGRRARTESRPYLRMRLAQLSQIHAEVGSASSSSYASFSRPGEGRKANEARAGGGGGIDCEMSCWTRLSGQDIFQIRGAASGHRGAEAVGKAAEAARHGRGRRRQQRQRSSVGAVKEQAPRPRGGSDGVGKGKSHHLPTGQARDIPGRPPDCLRSAVGPVCGGEEKERGGRRGAVRARRRWRWTQRGKAAPQEGTTNGA